MNKKIISTGIASLIVIALIIPVLAASQTYRDGDYIVIIDEEDVFVIFEPQRTLLERLFEFLAITEYPDYTTITLNKAGNVWTETYKGYTFIVTNPTVSMSPTIYFSVPLTIKYNGETIYADSKFGLYHDRNNAAILFDRGVIVKCGQMGASSGVVTWVGLTFHETNFVCNPSDDSLKCDSTFTKVIRCADDGLKWDVVEDCSYRCENAICLAAPTPTPRPTLTPQPTYTPIPSPTPTPAPNGITECYRGDLECIDNNLYICAMDGSGWNLHVECKYGCQEDADACILGPWDTIKEVLKGTALEGYEKETLAGAGLLIVLLTFVLMRRQQRR